MIHLVSAAALLLQWAPFPAGHRPQASRHGRCACWGKEVWQLWPVMWARRSRSATAMMAAPPRACPWLQWSAPVHVTARFQRSCRVCSPFVRIRCRLVVICCAFTETHPGHSSTTTDHRAMGNLHRLWSKRWVWSSIYGHARCRSNSCVWILEPSNSVFGTFEAPRRPGGTDLVSTWMPMNLDSSWRNRRTKLQTYHLVNETCCSKFTICFFEAEQCNNHGISFAVGATSWIGNTKPWYSKVTICFFLRQTS